MTSAPPQRGPWDGVSARSLLARDGAASVRATFFRRVAT
jgi:hypothetical protein